MNQPTTPPTAPHTSVDWGIPALFMPRAGSHVFEDRSEDQDERHDGEDDPRGTRAAHPRPHEDRASDDGRGGPDLHDRADHSDEDDDANDDGSKDAHGLIVSFSFVCAFHQTSLALITWLRYPDPQEC